MCIKRIFDIFRAKLGHCVICGKETYPGLELCASCRGKLSTTYKITTTVERDEKCPKCKGENVELSSEILRYRNWYCCDCSYRWQIRINKGGN